MTDKQVINPQDISNKLPEGGVINQGGTDIGKALSEVINKNEKLDAKAGVIYFDMETEELVTKEYVPIPPEQILDKLSEIRLNIPNEDFSRTSNVMKYHSEYQEFKKAKEKLSYPEGMEQISKDKDEELKDLAKLMVADPKALRESDNVMNKIKNLRDDTTKDDPINKPR